GATVRFAARPALAQISEAAIDTAVDRGDPNNQIDHFARDATAQLRFTAKATASAGYTITEQRYDALSQLVQNRGYATTVSHIGPASTSPVYDESAFAAAVVADPKNDRISVI